MSEAVHRHLCACVCNPHVMRLNDSFNSHAHVELFGNRNEQGDTVSTCPQYFTDSNVVIESAGSYTTVQADAEWTIRRARQIENCTLAMTMQFCAIQLKEVQRHLQQLAQTWTPGESCCSPGGPQCSAQLPQQQPQDSESHPQPEHTAQRSLSATPKTTIAITIFCAVDPGLQQ